MQSGILIIDKPRGPTSHDVVARLRRTLRTREVGHAGTLDPMATGVLVVALGEATKLAAYLTAHEKSYETTLALGVATDTFDALGQVLGTSPVEGVIREALRRQDWGAPCLATALDAERARTDQVPPAHSAVHVAGERAYELARRGEAVDLPPREVRVRRLEPISAGEDGGGPWLTLSLDVSKGYYVRALARDLAGALGTTGHLTALRRTRSGPFLASEAISPDAPAADLEARIVPLEIAAARALPTLRLTLTGARDAGFGRRVAADEIEVAGTRDPGVYAWFEPGGRLVAIGEVGEDGAGRVVRGFGRPVTSSSSRGS